MLNYKKDDRKAMPPTSRARASDLKTRLLKRGRMAVTIAGNFSLLLEVGGPKLIEMRLRSART